MNNLIPDLTMSQEDLIEFRNNNLSYIEELKNDARKHIENSEKKEKLEELILLAESGKFQQSFFTNKEFLSGYMRSILPNPDIYSGHLAAFLGILYHINDTSRENFYTNYAAAGDDIIEQERQMAILMYKGLDQDLDMFYYFVAKKKLVQDSNGAKKVRKEIQEKLDYSKYHEVGIEHINHIPTEVFWENSIIKYPPEAYDATLAHIRLSVLNPRLSSYSKEVFDESHRIISEKIQQIESMTTKEYRVYRMKLMKILPNEKENYDQKITKFLETKDDTKGHDNR